MGAPAASSRNIKTPRVIQLKKTEIKHFQTKPMLYKINFVWNS